MSEFEDLIAAIKIEEISGETPGFMIDTYVFTPDLINADGAVLKFEPRSYSRILRVAEGWKFSDVITKGAGWFLSRETDGKINVKRVRAGETLSPITYGNGMITGYVAGKLGLEIHEISTPPFDPEKTELEVEEDDVYGQSLNPKFWQIYKLLRNGALNP